METLDKGKIHMLGGTEPGLHHAPQNVHNLKVMNGLFLEFSILYFWILVAGGELKPWGNKIMDKGGLLYLKGF